MLIRLKVVTTTTTTTVHREPVVPSCIPPQDSKHQVSLNPTKIFIYVFILPSVHTLEHS